MKLWVNITQNGLKETKENFLRMYSKHSEDRLVEKNEKQIEEQIKEQIEEQIKEQIK